MKPRSDVVVRRFLAGESIGDLAIHFASREGGFPSFGAARDYVESCIRRALGRKGKR